MPIFSPDGRQIATAEWGADTQMSVTKLWNALTGEARITLGIRQTRIRPLAFSPDGHRLLTGSMDNPLCTLWDTATGREESTLSDPTLSGVSAAAFSADGKQIVMVNQNVAVMRVQPLQARQPKRGQS
jgi:WD40 repeat protein